MNLESVANDIKTFDAIKNSFFESFISHIPQFLVGIVLLVFGLGIIKLVRFILRRFLERTRADSTLVPFITSSVDMILTLTLLLSVASTIGIKTTSFIAILGSAGLAIGLALQGSLSNIAGGVIILFLRPFRSGDTIEAQGITGVVRRIQIFNTILTTADNKRIFLPNGPLANSTIINQSIEERRRVDLVFGIGYNHNIGEVRKIMLDSLKDDTRILSIPSTPVVVVTNLGDNSVDLTLRVWVKNSDHGQVTVDFREKIKTLFDENKISIPFPQREVRVIKE
jgi:small conductance mechanosensitive channel